ncbi:Heat shock 70 kDa protein 12A [Mactra antiquata]
MSNKREISYFGPFYVNSQFGSNFHGGTSNKETTKIKESPFNIRKYTIPPSNNDDLHKVKFIHTARGEPVSEHSNHNGRNVDIKNDIPTADRRPINKFLSSDRNKDIAYNMNRRSGQDCSQFQNRDDVKHTTPEREYTFKVSSTEDNYVFNKFKEKSKVDSAKQDELDKSEQPETVMITCNEIETIRSAEKGTQSSPPTKTRKHKEFFARHRSKIARMKRKFFENNIEPKPIVLDDTVNSGNIDNDQDEESRTSKTDDTPPPKPPRTSNVSTHFGSESKASFLRKMKHRDSQHQRRHSTDGALVRSAFEELELHCADASKQFLVVVAIDFGTTYSGYAYSFNYEPETIHMMRHQDSGDPGIYNYKIPTCILLTPEGNFHSFGYAADEYFRDLDQKEAVNWLYFDRFKMMLHEERINGLNRDTRLKTRSGREFSALKVFSYSLAYFKDLVMQEFADQSGIGITSDVIRWVITVPAIWKASAKQFMRLAAYEAGIIAEDQPDQLLIALEPEAASVYCRRLRMFNILASADSPARTSVSLMNSASSRSLPELRSSEVTFVSNDLEIGTRYMVVDCGGGTVDITVHELMENGRLKELLRASGGSHGSVGIDEAFETLLVRIFGRDIIENFKKKRPSGWRELMSIFESRKRTASPHRSTYISVTIPFSFIEFYKKCRGSSVSTAVRQYGDEEITWTNNGMLKLSPGVMRRLFVPTVDKIKQSIGAVLNNRKVTGIEYMFLVGGFSESSIVQHEMRRDFGSILKIIIPPGVSMTILKGAVCYGQDPLVVTSRCSCYSYGVGVLHRFDPSKHDINKKVSKDGVDWCTDIFDIFVHVDQSVDLGETIVRRYTPVRRDQNATTINVYSTENDDVMYISDPSVSKCGTLNLKLANISTGSAPRREVKTEMMFGDTEIRVRAIDVTGGESVIAEVDFINI